MAELDTSIPMSYKYGPSPLEQMGQVMTLRDLMQQRQARQVQIDETIRQQQAAEQARQADLEMGKQVVATAKAKREVPSTPAIQATPVAAPVINQPIQPEPIAQPQEPIGPDASQTLSNIKMPEYMSSISSFKGPSSLIPQNGISGTIDQTQVVPPSPAPQQNVPEQVAQSPAQQAAPVPETPAKQANPLDLDEEEQAQVLNIFGKYGYAKGMELKDKMISSKKMRLDAENMILEGEKLRAEAFKLRNVSDMFGKTPTGLDMMKAQDPTYIAGVLADIKNRYDSGLLDEASYKALSYTANMRPVSVYDELKTAMAEHAKKPTVEAELTNKQKEAALKTQELELKKKELESKTREEAKKAEAETEAIQVGKAQVEDSISQINRLIDDFSSGKVSTGMLSNWWASTYTSGNTAAAKAMFDNIKANLTLKRLTDLKAAGGTLGALSEGERIALEKAASLLRFEGDVQSNIVELQRIAKIFKAARSNYESKEARKNGQPAIKAKDVPTTKDAQAIKWAKENPTDPRAIKILQLHGVK